VNEGGVKVSFTRPRAFILGGAVIGAVTLSGAALAGVGTTAKTPAFLPACVQKGGSPESVGDVNVGTRTKSCKGSKSFKLALFPVRGVRGPAGPTGPAGPAGPAGTNGFTGGFFSVQTYKGAIGPGAIATAACDPTDAANSQKFVAISGGVQNTDNSTDMTTNTGQVPVVASFPGRMNFTTNTPLPNRLDGWIIQFGHTGQQDNNPSVWALCVPRSIPVHVH
jgi:hypothetical protein